MKAFILCALLLFVVAANAGRVAMPVMRSDDQAPTTTTTTTTPATTTPTTSTEGKKSACYSATADMCQDSADRGVCKNKEIVNDYLNNDDDSIQDEIDYFDKLNEDITLCPQCGCKNAQPTALLNPNSPGCWIRFPSGCPNQKHEEKYDNLQDPTIWRNETFNGASESIDKCIARKSQINTWCGVSDVIFEYQSGRDAAGDAGRDALCWEGHSQYYSGKIAISEKGHICKSWADKKDSTFKVQGEEIKIQDGYFPDGSLENAANYCRSPDNDRDGPWCFVDGDGDAWQHCDVPLCNGFRFQIIEKKLEKLEKEVDFLFEEIGYLEEQQEYDYDEDQKQDSSMDEDASKASNSGDVGTVGAGSICTFGLCM